MGYLCRYEIKKDISQLQKPRQTQFFCFICEVSLCNRFDYRVGASPEASPTIVVLPIQQYTCHERFHHPNLKYPSFYALRFSDGFA